MATSWDAARREAQAWLVGEKKFLVLLGNPGTGKTTMVADLAYPPVPTRSHREVTIHWQTNPWVPSSEPHYRLMCLDDVKDNLKGQYAASGREVLGNLIDDIEAHHGYRLILTTNLDLNAFGELLDAGAKDRLRGHGVWIQFSFKSFRGTSGEKKAASRPVVTVSPVEAFVLYRHRLGGFLRLVNCNPVAERWEVRRFTDANPTGVTLWLTSDEIKQNVLEPFAPDVEGDTPMAQAKNRMILFRRELPLPASWWEALAKKQSIPLGGGTGSQSGPRPLSALPPPHVMEILLAADPEGYALYQYRLENPNGN